MHDDHVVAEERIRQALARRIRPAVYRDRVPLGVGGWVAGFDPVSVRAALTAGYQALELPAPWGSPWSTTWFRFSGRLPAAWEGQWVEAVVDLGFAADQPGFSAEGLAYSADGVPVKGLSAANSWVPVAADPATPVLFYVEAAANPRIEPGGGGAPTSLGDPLTAGDELLYALRRAELCLLDPVVWELTIDMQVLDGLMRELPLTEPRRHLLRRALERAVTRIDAAGVHAGAADARKELAGALEQPAHASAHRITATGNAHIDSAWLWPQRETRRKVARTVANATHLLAANPRYRFAFSQAQQLAWLAEGYPELWQRVRQAVAAGGFVPVGGLWVEPDGNLPGGEAMARQLVYGKRFFLEQLGVETEEVWLPDSFGYSAALPQIARLAGNRWMLTQKLSWNQTNRFPHHSFWWEGIDGSRIFTHFPPVDTYNSELSAAELARAASQYAEHGRGGRSLVPFGYGDGGGGPTREMLAVSERLADLEGSPVVSLGTPAEFFRQAEDEYPDAPVWAGELYLELHRGTFTTQAATKRGNRRSEHLLREAELWATTAWVAGVAPYPWDDLERLWKAVLVHQFHDILPGTSIAWVHREAAEAYRALGAELEQLITSSLRALAGEGDRLVRFNAAPHARDGVAPLGAAFGDGRGDTSAAERSGGPAAVTVGDNGAGATVLDNGLLRVVVDGRGLLTSVMDLVADRELVAAGAAANLLQLHPDHPNNWDAWDVDSFYRDSRVDLDTADEIHVAGGDPLAASVRVRRSFGSSSFEQTVRLRAGARLVELDTVVDWQERARFLKLAFPLAIHADRVGAEVQFGHVHRPTHTNTSWEAARFEVWNHRWIHAGEAGYGVALVNDATYGHDVRREPGPGGGTTLTLRQSLLRAPSFPDPQADRGRHEFHHALVAGAGIDEAIAEGYRINLPLRRVAGARSVPPVVAVDGAGVIVESIKAADDRSGDVVVRLYECLGGRASAVLTPQFELLAASEADLLERPLGDLRVEANSVRLRLRPFQILTLRLARPAPPP